MTTRKKCGAKTRAGGTCDNWAMPNGRCRMHGGKTPAGRDAPQTNHGRYSKILPERLAARYEESLTDPRLLELSDEIALMDARIADLLEMASIGAGIELFTQMKKVFDEMAGAFRDGDEDLFRAHMATLGGLINRSAGNERTWAKVEKTIDIRRKLAESERSHKAQLEQYIPLQRFMLLIAALTSSVNAHVTDRQARSNIASDIRSLLTVEN